MRLVLIISEDLYVLDELGEVAAFNTRTNPALWTSTWSYSEELGQQLKLLPIVKVYQAFTIIIMTLYIGPFTCLALYESAMDEVCASIVEMDS